MPAKDYFDLACNIVGVSPALDAGIPHLGNFDSWASKTATDALIEKRLQFLIEIYGEAESKNINLDQPKESFLPYRIYIDTITKNLKDIVKLYHDYDVVVTAKKRVAESGLSTYAADPRIHSAKMNIILQVTGVNLPEAEKQFDRIKAKLARYKPMQVDLATSYDPEIFTPDRTGYFRYLELLSPAFARTLKQPISFNPKPSDREKHTYILGATGSGKSELIKQLIYPLALNPEHGAVVLIDPHGDISRQIARWQEFAFNDRLVYIEPGLYENHFPVMNPLDVPIANETQKNLLTNQFVQVFEHLLKGAGGQSLTLNMRAVLAPCFDVLLGVKGAGLIHLQQFMQDDKALIEFGRRSERAAIKAFFTDNFENNPNLRTSKGAISTKLQSLFNFHVFEKMVTGESTINLAELVDQRKIVIFNLSKGQLGDDVSEAIGRFIIANIQALALRRDGVPENQRVPLNLFVDECQNFISPAITSILEEARKYGIRLTLAQQIGGRGMPRELLDVIIANTALKLQGFTQGDKTLAEVMECSTEQFHSYHVGQFSFRSGRDAPFTFQASADLIDNNNSMTDEQWHATLSRMTHYYQAI